MTKDCLWWAVLPNPRMAGELFASRHLAPDRISNKA